MARNRSSKHRKSPLLGRPTIGLALTVTLGATLLGVEPASAGAAPATAPLGQPGQLGQQQGRAGGTPRSKPRTRPRIAPLPGDDGARLGADSGDRSDGRPDVRGRGLGLSGTGSSFAFPAEREQRSWFNIADADSTGWVSFREAQGSMRFDDGRFRAYDTDNDGRITFVEFAEFIRNERALGRNVLKPVPTDIDGQAPTRTAEQLRAAYDTDFDGSISQVELDSILGDYDQGGARFDSDTVLRRLDADGNNVLEVAELGRLANYLTPPGSAAGPSAAPPGARSVGELFGTPIDQGEAHPPRILGPIHPFRRLDVDNDGYVDMADLERLEGRSFSPVSLKSVLNTLDVNFDGRVSEREFMTSITPKRR